jgi:hypothetical protein
VLPIRMVTGDPQPHPQLRPGIPTPGYITNYHRPGDAR